MSLCGNGRSPNDMLRALGAGHIDISSITALEAQSIYSYCKLLTAQRQRRIFVLIGDDEQRKAQQAIRKFMRAFATRLVCVLSAIGKMRKRHRRRGNQRVRMPFSIVWKLAGHLKVLNNQPEGLLWQKRKHGGGVRPIYEYETLEIARQSLLALSLEPFARRHSSQYTLHRGRTIACEDLQKALTEAPISATFVHIDVRNYYGSISHRWLREYLPLNEGSLRGLFIPACTGRSAIVRPNAGEESQMGQRGIPQGSVVSPIVADMVMAQLLNDLSPEIGESFVISYSDNIGILFKEEQDWTALRSRIEAIFRDHSAGPFQITFSAGSVPRRFGFLGYQWQRRGVRCIVRMKPRAKEIHEGYFIAALVNAETDRDVRILRERINGYFGAFSLAPEAVEAKERLSRLATDELNHRRARRSRRLRAPLAV